MLAPTWYLDSDHPAVVMFAREVIGGATTDRARESRLFTAVRERLRARIADATPVERQELVRAWGASGGAVFKGRQVQLTLFVELEDRDTVRPSLTVVQACASG